MKVFFTDRFSDYMKKVLNKLTEKGAPQEKIDEFKAGAPAAVKKLLSNYDNYDVLMGTSMDGDAMYVQSARIPTK